jgi:hypothetical protein
MPKPVRFLLPTFTNIGFGGTILVNVLRAVTFFYDWTTFFFYYWKQDPKPPFIIKTHKQSKVKYYYGFCIIYLGYINK